jgi:cell division protein FtsI/penicillin-binding protein 2
LSRRVEVPPEALGQLEGPLTVEYSLDPALTDAVWQILGRGRVALGHVIVMEPGSGRLLAYLSTDPERFPPTRSYPAASLIKVITAAALLDSHPPASQRSCRFAGNPYRLNRRRLDPPRRGNEASLRRALATSNNQCFAQWAVHEIGSQPLLSAIDRFGWLSPAGPGHPAGRAEDPTGDALELGRLGSGLAGMRITPLHAASLAGTLAHGLRVQPSWIERISDGRGRALPLPPAGLGERVLTPDLAGKLREMLVDTTVRGTAHRAFRTRRGRPLLQGIAVAGKTGSLNGRDPDGRYEWFIGLAPAQEPKVAVAVVSVQGPLYWMSASQLGAEVLKAVFCPDGVCRLESAERFAQRSPSTASF